MRRTNNGAVAPLPENARSPFASWLEWAAAAVPAAVTCTFLMYAFAVSEAVLLFAEPFPDKLGVGVGMALAGSLVVALTVGLGSRMHGVIGGSQEVVVVMLAAIVVDLQQRMPASLSTDARFVTVVAALLLCGVSIAFACYVVQRLGLGRFVHYLPWPVMAGLLVGSGVALLAAALPIITNVVPLEMVTAAWQGDASGREWLALTLGLALMAVLTFASREERHALMPVAALAVSMATFFTVAYLSGYDLETLRNTGWTLSRSPQVIVWPAVSLPDARMVDIPALIAVLPSIIAVTVVATIVLLMKIGALGSVFRHDVNERRELKTAGLGSLASALVVGVTGFHAITPTLALKQMRSSNRGTVCLVVLFCLLIWPLAGVALSMMPGFVIGGVLGWLGLGLVRGWLHDHDGSMSRTEVGVAALIALAILIYGFGTGLVVGLASAVALFLRDYSRVDVLRDTMSPVDVRSNVDRSGAHLAELAAHADRLLVFRLKGFLFFGTAHRLLEQLRAELASRERSEERPLWLMLDFEQVTGMDSSTLQALSRFRELAAEPSLRLVVCASEDAGLSFGALANAESVRRYNTLDEALQAREDALLDVVHGNGVRDAGDFVDMLGDEVVLELGRWAKTVHLPTGGVLVTEGEPGNALYIVRSGRIDVRIARAGRPSRVRSVGPGAMLGELSVLLGGPASATLTAAVPSKVWRLTPEALNRIMAADTEQAAQVYGLMARTMAQRLVDSNRLIRMSSG